MIRLELQIDHAQAHGLYEEGFEALRPDINRYVKAAAEDFKARLLATMRKSQTGEPSQPGEPPAVQSGEYVRSYETDVKNYKRSVHGRIGTPLAYVALILEFGSKFMKPRRHILRTFYRWRAALDRHL
jgi:hypothetical protein